jgi:glycosyltransferase involved in cell wall biosynthesis
MTGQATAVRRLSYLAIAKVPGPHAHSMQIVKTCEALARRLDEVELVVPRLGPRPAQSEAPQGVRLVRVAAPNLLPLGRWAPQSVMRFLFNVQSTAFALVTLARALARRRFDVYYTRSPFAALGLGLAFGRRAVLELHMPIYSAKRRRLLRLCRALGCRFVTVSDALRRRIAAMVGVPADEIGAAPNGHDPAMFSAGLARAAARDGLGLSGDAFVLCYVGTAATFGKPKGIPFIVEGFRQAALAGSALLLAGVEPGEAGPPVEGVRCLGRIPHAEMAYVLRASDAAVMLFLDEPAHAHVMSPLKLFEYLGAGLPIITPDLPNLREIVDESCAVFVPAWGDVGALADAIRRVGSDPALRTRLGAAAAERARAYTWDARAERVLSFLRSGRG